MRIVTCDLGSLLSLREEVLRTGGFAHFLGCFGALGWAGIGAGMGGWEDGLCGRGFRALCLFVCVCVCVLCFVSCVLLGIAIDVAVM